MSYIRFENVVKKFGDNMVLKGIDLDIERGDFVTLLGPSGCGKSTLLRCLSGLEDVSGGRIFLDGKEITYTEPSKREIGMVFQQYSLFPNMNVFDNIAFGLRMKKTPQDEISAKVKKAVEMVALEGRENAMPSELSGGQQQRVALARSIVTEPKVLLLDEPLSAIDAKLRKSLQKEIRRIQRDMGITTVFVTHDQDEAMVMSDVIHLFNAGRIEQSGSPIEMYTRPASTRLERSRRPPRDRRAIAGLRARRRGIPVRRKDNRPDAARQRPALPHTRERAGDTLRHALPQPRALRERRHRPHHDNGQELHKAVERWKTFAASPSAGTGTRATCTATRRTPTGI